MAGLVGSMGTKIVAKQMESQVKDATQSAVDAATPPSGGRKKGKKKFGDFFPFGKGDGKPSNHRKLSVFVSICCIPFCCGLCGLLFSYLIDSCWNKKNEKCAKRLSSCVYNCNLMGIACGVLSLVVIVVVFLMVVSTV